jgi:hypothetical protein
MLRRPGKADVEALRTPVPTFRLIRCIVLAGEDAPYLLDEVSIERGKDKYSLENIGSWFAHNPLQQVLRLGKLSFVNRDVQTVFKIRAL